MSLPTASSSACSGRRCGWNGSRMLVRQVVAQLRESRGDVDEVADYLGIEWALVRAARDYYADFGAEIDVDAVWAVEVEARERARSEHQQAVLA
jgi:hypothetical protein